MDRSTIAAIATAAGNAGIGIVKISGNQAIAITASLFHPARSSANWTLSHRLCYGRIKAPDNGELVDDVLVSVMRAPFSYTGEDVVEINAHGGRFVLERILELVLDAGARLAGPGEYTRRAFVNGRIDLTQAEAVIDIVMAKTALQQRHAAAQRDGRLSAVVSALRQELVQALVALEAAIDFPEDIADEQPQALAERLATTVLTPAQALADAYRDGRLLREGVRLALVGRPNVGKSSLLNKLLDSDRVIVTPYPGTTRDVIEETIMIDGVTIALADTAGLHESADPIETLGMARTRAHAQRCDLVVFVVEANALGPDETLIEPFQEKPLIVAINKIDLADEQALAKTSTYWHRYPQVRVSALTGAGTATLKAAIGQICLGQGMTDPDMLVPAKRHQQAIVQVIDHTRLAIDGLLDGLPAELVCMELQTARAAADAMLGIDAPPELLDEIFSRFCIGK